MARRTVQSVLRQDPRYEGAFGDKPVERPAEPAVVVSSQVMAPIPQGVDAPVEQAAPVMVKATTAPDPGTSSAPGPRIAPAAARSGTPKAKQGKPGRGQGVAVPIRLRPLLRQAARLEATGLPPRDVMRAAWRKATAALGAGALRFVPPQDEERVSGNVVLTTTWMVDAGMVATMARDHDPLNVKGPWSLLRGQAEPAFWQALDEVLDELDAHRGAAR